MKMRYLAMALVALTITRAASADTFGEEQKTGLFIGQTALMGDGSVRSWVNLDESRRPTAVGVTFTDLALEGLPTDGESEFMVKLPKEASMTPYDHIAVDWNPHGHPPVGVYDVPHFDFHFYMISVKQRARITAVGNDLKICDKPLLEGLLPVDYFMAIGTEVPHMGVHCIDGTSPELHGAPFSSTFIYGAYNGHIIFQEPMVALSTILARNDIVLPIKQPAWVEESGFYPTVYAVTYNAIRQETTVELREFVWRNGKGRRRD